MWFDLSSCIAPKVFRMTWPTSMGVFRLLENLAVIGTVETYPSTTVPSNGTCQCPFWFGSKLLQVKATYWSQWASGLPDRIVS